MARCAHGFERAAVPCPECDGARKRAHRNDVHRKRYAERKEGIPRKPHPAFRDLTGLVFQRAVVIERAPNVQGVAHWRIRMPCGCVRVLAGIQIRAPRVVWHCPECGVAV